MTESELWEEHEDLHRKFVKRLTHLGDSGLSLETIEPHEFNYLDLKNELVNRILHECVLCEWRCKVDRVDGKKKGACHLDSTARVATFFRHFGEEPPLVDRSGSGTIFFTSCNFRCCYCQNWDISQAPKAGSPVTSRNLSVMMESLRNEGAANINFVGGEPTPNLHMILEAIRSTSVNVPILWNSNMYLTAEAMNILTDVVDIWLPDFKYGNDRCAIEYSLVVKYFETTSRNHKIAYENGDMIIRHLVMPGHVECCTKPILKWIAENCPRALVNVMSQYRPEHLVLQQPKRYNKIAHKTSIQEMREARAYADQLGLIWRPVS
jgi:putative pyruvate formate lyase activating enzyme